MRASGAGQLELAEGLQLPHFSPQQTPGIRAALESAVFNST